jgi:glycosyltransferase involved in cell wall biosynthesis
MHGLSRCRSSRQRCRADNCGSSPTYLFRQLYDFKSAARKSLNSDTMKPSVEKLTLTDMTCERALRLIIDPVHRDNLLELVGWHESWAGGKIGAAPRMCARRIWTRGSGVPSMVVKPLRNMTSNFIIHRSSHARGRRLCYFALDVPHRGQASFIHITEMVKNLREWGWQIDLYAPVPIRNGEQPLLISRLLAHARVILRTLLRLRNYDAIYIRAHFFAWPVTFAAHWMRLVIFHEVNGSFRDVVVSYPWLTPLAGFIAWLYRLQLRRSDHVLPVTQGLAEWLRRESVQCPITVVSNAANTALFRPLARTAAAPFVVFFGGLTKWHGVNLMADAVQHPAWPTGVELIVIGAGSKLCEILAAQKTGAPVHWLGYRPNQEIPELIAGAIAGLVPITDPSGRSSTGVLPLKLYELLACGLPAIVTDIPGQADLVREGQCGLVIAPDAAALALAVAHLRSHPEEAKAMGARGAQFVASAHSWAARAADVNAILTACLREKSGRAQDRTVSISRRWPPQVAKSLLRGCYKWQNLARLWGRTGARE